MVRIVDLEIIPGTVNMRLKFTLDGMPIYLTHTPPLFPRGIIKEPPIDMLSENPEKTHTE